MISAELQSQLRAQYNPDGSLLRQGQMRMLDILKCVDTICRKHRIPYWLSSGTLLGAVRHGGFIPWDDDLDIEMLREDYLKLLPLLRKELPEQYVLQDGQSEKDYPFLFVKVRDKHSLMQEDYDYGLTYKGLFIDIFPLERSNTPVFLFSKYLYLLLVIKPYKCRFFSRWGQRFLQKVLFPFFRCFFRHSQSPWIRHTIGMPFCKARLLENIFPLVEIPFEDGHFFAPRHSDRYLTDMFGDYGNLPKHIEVHGSVVSVD